MSLLTETKSFPPIQPFTKNDVTAEERSSAIDYINRVNFLFEEFDHDKLLNAWLPDGSVYHFHGTVHGYDQMKKFLQETYGYLIPGVSRHATNHIVDRDEETGGVIVRYHQHLTRYAWPRDAETITKGAGQETTSKDDLPATWQFAPSIDRLKMTDEGWKIYERYLGGSVTNERLTPKA